MMIGGSYTQVELIETKNNKMDVVTNNLSDLLAVRHCISPKHCNTRVDHQELISLLKKLKLSDDMEQLLDEPDFEGPKAINEAMALTKSLGRSQRASDENERS